VKIALPRLPYSKDALAPHISEETLHFHHDKHHKAYVDKTNELLKESPLKDKPLEEIVQAAEGELFNNAAQVWNHAFYWHSMRPGGGGKPKGALLRSIDKHFGSFDDFRDQFKQAAVSQFGTGWAWLVEDKGSLRVMKTGDADLPMRHGLRALLTCDVWEHAYYVDYRNERPKYVEAFLDHLLDWEWAEKNLETPAVFPMT
jgi:Fe-Mn family superoxide dismutase